MIYRSLSKRPAEETVGLDNGDVIDRGLTQAHKTPLVKLPLLVTMTAPPLPGWIVTLVHETDRDADVGERPDFLDQAVFKFALPFSGKELDDRRSTLKEL